MCAEEALTTKPYKRQKQLPKGSTQIELSVYIDIFLLETKMNSRGETLAQDPLSQGFNFWLFL